MSAAPFVAHLASAGELVASKKFGEAEGEILRALSVAPTDAKALTLLALVRYKLGRFEEAHATYREIAGVAPHDAGARRNLGLLSLKLGRLDEALPELEMAVRLAPGDTRAWSYLGYAYSKKGEVVQAAAAFRRAGQEVLAGELDQVAMVQRPPTPMLGGGSAGGLGSPGGGSAGGVGSMGRPVALAPPLPPMPPTTAGGKRSAVRRQPAELAEAPAHVVRAAPEVLEPPQPREVEPVPLLSFVLARLGQAASPTIPTGAFRLSVADEGHARADAILAGSGTVKWEPGVRRAQGRVTSEPLGRPGASSYFRLTGGGDVWIAGAAGRWLPLRLADDVLYVREDRVLAFEGSLTWEAGEVPNTGLRMLQFRGRGTVALELPADAIAIKVTDDKPTLISAARLYGWVGRLVPHGDRMPGAAPFQLGCQGEGVVLLEAFPLAGVV
ncbi:MAG TPA: tetratricopeptide repeat protein [Polyangia bacterium]|nr:tetratricopeptide repeat protein [Polyangia bacterium]